MLWIIGGRHQFIKLNLVCGAVACWVEMLLSNGLGCCGVSEEDINLMTEFGVGSC